MITFRVHLSDGAKVDVTAETPKQAGDIAVRRHPGTSVSKIKTVRDGVHASERGEAYGRGRKPP